ncbi:hypothetical protein D3C87_1968210 [compost metagenome]
MINDYARDPIMGVFGQVSSKTWLEMAAASILGIAAAKAVGSRKFSDRVEKFEKLVRGKSTGGAVVSCQRVLLVQ